jgi:hypothetical protein
MKKQKKPTFLGYFFPHLRFCIDLTKRPFGRFFQQKHLVTLKDTYVTKGQCCECKVQAEDLADLPLQLGDCFRPRIIKPWLPNSAKVGRWKKDFKYLRENFMFYSTHVIPGNDVMIF